MLGGPTVTGLPRPPMAPMFEAQSKWNELTRPHGVKRHVSVHQTP